MRKILLAFLLWFISPALPAADLEGLTLLVVGDSYVQNHKRPAGETWHSRAADSLGMKYINKGINGNCIAFDRSDRGFGRQLVDRVEELPAGADYILVIAGHNDAVIIGREPEKYAVFEAALDRLMLRLKERYPQAKIGFVTPWQVDQPGFEEVIRAIESAGKRHGIPVMSHAGNPVIDVNNVAFREKYFQDKGINDKAHLNYDGHALMIGAGVDFLRML